eukprot:6723940-Prymnesium_polylepis.1
MVIRRDPVRRLARQQPPNREAGACGAAPTACSAPSSRRTASRTTAGARSSSSETSSSSTPTSPTRCARLQHLTRETRSQAGPDANPRPVPIAPHPRARTH